MEEELIDYLSREEYVFRLKELLDASCERKESSSIALYGTWGSGKSFVLRMLEKELIASDYFVIKYDAWEKDFYDEPLVGILYSFAIQLNNQLKAVNFIKGLTAEIICKALCVVSNIIGAITNKIIGIDVPKQFKKIYKEIKNTISKNEIKTTFNNNIGIEEAREQVRAAIGELSSYANVVLLIDEIDRCLPDYGLKVLERLHHFVFGIPNVQSITAVDNNQLNNIVQRYYGKDVDCDNYLQKFFNIKLLLNGGNFTNKFFKKYKEYLDLFILDPPFGGQNEIMDFIQLLFSNKNARTVDESVMKALKVHKILCEKEKHYSKAQMCVELLFSYLSIVGKRPDVFEKFFGKERCIPSSISEIVHEPSDKSLIEIIDFIEQDRRYLVSSRNSTTFSIKGFAGFIWFAIANNCKIHSNRIFTFTTDFQQFKNVLKDHFKYLSSFADYIFTI